MRKRKYKWILFEGRRVKDITGSVYNMLTAISPVGFIKGKCVWKFNCQCGNQKNIIGAKLRFGRYKSCGCLRAKILEGGIPLYCVNAATVANFKDLSATKKKFGRLRPIDLWTRKKRVCKGKNYWVNYWECICDCGNTHIVEGGLLISGKTKSCGCLKSELASVRMKERLAARRLIKQTKLENQNCGNYS